LLEEVIVVNKAVKLILKDIEDSSLTTMNPTHVPDLISDAGFPVLSENSETSGSRQHLTSNRAHLDSELVLLAGNEGPGSEGGLVVAGDVGEGHAEGTFGVAGLLLDEVLGGLFEQGEDVGVHVFEVLKNSLGRGTDHIFRLRNPDSGKLDTSVPLDVLNEELGLLRVERNALA